MLHASYAYPSELVPFVEVGLTLLALLLVLWQPAGVDRRIRRAWRRLATLSRGRAVLASGAGGLLLCLASYVPLGLPVPFVADELGYLLIGDTLAHGRLANPEPRVPEAFQAVFLLARPVYASHRPPAYSIGLAAGQLLGHPGVGVALWIGLLAAATCWFLQAWLPPPWPLAGAALLTLRVGVDSYWGQSYWGGAATAVGGMLVYGALPRLWGRRPERPWAAIAVGLLLLANSRPLEGLVAAVPAAVSIAALAVARWRVAFRPLLLPLVLSLGAAAALTMAYDRAITGNPLKIPYQLFRETYGNENPIPFAPPPPPVQYSSPVMAAHLAMRYERPSGVGRALAAGAGHLSRIAYFVCGLPLLGCAVAALLRPRGWKLFALLCAVLQAAVHSVTLFWFPHYSAAATGPLLLLGLWGMREAATLRVRRRRLGAWLPLSALLAVQLPLTLVELPAHRPDPDIWTHQREALERRLLASGEPALVVIDDRLRTVDEWVFNSADLDHARVLWIQDLGPAVTRQVAAAYAPRRVWRAVPDEREGAVLVPFRTD